MLTSTAVVQMPTMTAPISDYGGGQLNHALELGAAGQRQFKRHKTLPRPRPERPLLNSPPRPAQYNIVIDPSQHRAASSQSSSPKTLKHQPKRIGTGPDLPPTPPNQSRTSSSSHSAVPTSPTRPDRSPKSSPSTVTRQPTTPPDQRSPPTPDVTPPQPALRPRGARSNASDRGASRTATTNSRAESFKTAREEPASSEDEGVRSVLRSDMASAGTSQTTVLRVPASTDSKVPQPQALDVALGRLQAAPELKRTSILRNELGQVDSDWCSTSEVEQEWDENLHRAVTVKKWQSTPDYRSAMKLAGSDSNPKIKNSPDVTKSAKQTSLREAPVLTTPTRVHSARTPRYTNQPNSDSPSSSDARRLSGVSSQSNAGAVVEAFLLEVDASPRRQRTLRHVRKQRTLRNSNEQTPESNSYDNSPITASRPPQTTSRVQSKARHESFASNSSSNSIASGRARREVWRNGAVPVVVIPDRHSSNRSVSSREPSLRSTSSHRSKRPQSLDSPLIGQIAVQDDSPSAERQARRMRAQSLSYNNDERTIDVHPSIPVRSSSLSAPTSRNVSRAGSMTAESARNGSSTQRVSAEPQQLTPTIRVPSPGPEGSVRSPGLWSNFADSETNETFGLDRFESLTPARKYSSRNTPFSVASIETSGTAPVVSEAQAIHMYPHQNSSLVMVDHSAKPSDASEESSRMDDLKEAPTITTTDPAGLPSTPPQSHSVLDEVDSPLRNPRAPPEPPGQSTVPPAIHFIPATPSGLTPAQEKVVDLGSSPQINIELPKRRPSIMHRALGRRRHSVTYPPSASKPPSFLTRALSLTRDGRRRTSSDSRFRENPDSTGNLAYPEAIEKPAEEDKLHPFWQPQWADNERCECKDCQRRQSDDEEYVYRYPAIDNRPSMPKRSLSARMKRTFAIMPIRDEPQYLADDMFGPERRTIRRTPSGNLRVMRHKSSSDSLKRARERQARPRTSPEGEGRRGFWRGYSMRKELSHESPRRSSIGSRLDEIQNIPRMLSERRREKRTQELRQKISGPREVRDGMGEVIRTGAIIQRHNTIS